MEDDEDDRALEMKCDRCGLRATAFISPAGELTEAPEGFVVQQDRGLDHTFTCRKCGVEAKLI